MSVTCSDYYNLWPARGVRPAKLDGLFTNSGIIEVRGFIIIIQNVHNNKAVLIFDTHIRLFGAIALNAHQFPRNCFKWEDDDDTHTSDFPATRRLKEFSSLIWNNSGNAHFVGWLPPQKKTVHSFLSWKSSELDWFSNHPSEWGYDILFDTLELLLYY